MNGLVDGKLSAELAVQRPQELDGQASAEALFAAPYGLTQQELAETVSITTEPLARAGRGANRPRV